MHRIIMKVDQQVLKEFYETPFTALHSDGLDGVFSDERMIEDVLAVVDAFSPPVMTAREVGHDVT